VAGETLPAVRVLVLISSIGSIERMWSTRGPIYVEGLSIAEKESCVMRTMRYCSLIIMAVVLTHAVAVGDDKSHRKAAENLLIVMDVPKSLPNLAEQVLEGQLKQNPQLMPYRDVMQRFLNKYLNWENLKEEVVTVYMQEFTEKELKQLTEFYKTPVGQKASEKMPRLAFAAGQIGLKRAQEHESELRQMMEAEKEKK